MARRGAAANARLMMLAMAAAVASRGAAVLSDYSKHSGSHRNDSHFEVLTPYEGEIFAQEDCFFEFRLHGDLVPRLASGHEILVGINGNEAMRTRDAYTSIKAPGLPAGLHYLILQVLDSAGAPGLLDFTVAFEVTEHPPPEQIVPLPAGTVGVRSDELPLAEDLDPQPYSAVLQQMFYDHQHPPMERCKTAPFVIWEPWGIVGFGAQLLGLRVAMALGLLYGRVIVGNPEWENNLVNSELKWRFNLTEIPDVGSPWGERGSLQPLSWCAGFQNIHESVRALPGVDMSDAQIRDVRVAGDLWGVENRDRLFDIPEAAIKVMPGAQQPPNLFWWWTETTHYLHRPTEKLGLFIEAQKARMGWRHPIIGIHMRLGVDKNREAQRFPTKYYMHEARRIRRLFSGGAQGDIGTIFVCSDRPRAVDKMIADYSSEFQILTQPRVEGALPMEYVHTDLSLLGEADYLIFTFSSNFGMAALYLNAWRYGHRPTYVSMDDLFEGFRYYGHQMTLSHNAQTGINELGVRKCYTQLMAGKATLHIVDDKAPDAEEICATVLGEELCRTPRQLRDNDSGKAVWDNLECERADEWDLCRRELVERYKFILGQAEAVKDKGDCEEECDDKGCKSLAAGNRRVLGFGVRLPRDEL